MTLRRDQRYIRGLSIADSEEVDYPFSIPAIRRFGYLELHPAVTYIVGENGSGKSTIVEALARCINLNPEGGTRNTRFSAHATESELWRSLTVELGGRTIHHAFFFRAESVFSLLAEAEAQRHQEFGWHIYGWNGRHKASHGESHLGIFKEKLNDGFYIFDEPEAALSPEKQLAFLAIIDDLCKNGAQILICTHSPIVLAYPQAWIYSLDHGAPLRIEYEQANSVVIYQAFLTRRQHMLKELLEGTDEPEEENPV